MKKINKKGTVMLYLTFMIVLIIIVILAGVLAPMGVLFNTKMYAVGEDLIIRANNTHLQEISDAGVKSEIEGVFSTALVSGQNNIDVNAALYRYGWVVALVITGLILFIYARRMVEYGGGIV